MQVVYPSHRGLNPSITGMSAIKQNPVNANITRLAPADIVRIIQYEFTGNVRTVLIIIDPATRNITH